jgi:HD-GYP domain-containing protein (c-di-GMP phosphodiesterase class II)
MPTQSSLDPRVREALHGALGAYHRATAAHTRRAAALAVRLGSDLGNRGPQLEVLEWAAKLHDVGKLCVTPELLDKPGKLTPSEWRAVQRHPVVGATMIRAISKEFAPVADAVRAHHEHWDGSGYPEGLAGRDIPAAARVVAIADAFDAMTSARSYQPARLTSADALAIIRLEAGSHFDPDLVGRFCLEGHDRFVLSRQP